ncbi:MAG: hypothetical protein ACM3QZ_13085 [Solirubrobacterales bacterium]
MTQVTHLITAALMVEAVWENSKMIFQKGKLVPDRIGALILGVFVSLESGIDAFQAAGIPFETPYLGSIFTGIIISRGANVVHDLFGSMQGGFQRTKSRRREAARLPREIQ